LKLEELLELLEEFDELDFELDKLELDNWITVIELDETELTTVLDEDCELLRLVELSEDELTEELLELVLETRVCDET
jgi:hypothetical protein